MKIGNFSVGMESNYQSRQKLEMTMTTKNLRGEAARQEKTEDTEQSTSKPTVLVDNENGGVSLSPESLALLQRGPKAQATSTKIGDAGGLDPKIYVLKRAVEALTGKKINLGPAFEGGQSANFVAPSAGNTEGVLTQVQEVTRTYTYSEQESVSFSAFGAIQTEDGRSFGFSLDFALERSYSETSTTISRETVTLTDPLVLNFQGTSAQLSENAKINFDLDADGSVEEFSFVGPGSGFLALDVHNDQSVRDGSQLFGTTSGNGFADLAAYDGDGNFWIDENDDVYARLLIWRLDENGNQQVQTLKEANVGAIYLGNTSTQFSMKGEDQKTTLGEVKRSGVFLKEDGSAGTVQQIDLAV